MSAAKATRWYDPATWWQEGIPTQDLRAHARGDVAEKPAPAAQPRKEGEGRTAKVVGLWVAGIACTAGGPVCVLLFLLTVVLFKRRAAEKRMTPEERERLYRERNASAANGIKWLLTPYPRHYLSVGPSGFPLVTIITAVLMLIYYL